MPRRPLAAAAVAAAALSLCGCGQSSPPASVSAPSVDPTAQAIEGARVGYYRALQTISAMEESPKAKLEEYPASLHIVDSIADPALRMLIANGKSQVDAGVTTKTVRGMSTPRAVSVNLGTGTVVFRHCPTDEKPTVMRGGKVIQTSPAPGQAPYPHMIHYTMTKKGPHWLLSMIEADGTRTCASD